MGGSATICIVDDDESVRESLDRLLRSYNFATRAFASAEELIAGIDFADAACLILDFTLPGMSGGELHEQLLARGERVPVVFITARVEEALHRRLLDRGAIACLVKPFSDVELLSAVEAATETTQ